MTTDSAFRNDTFTPPTDFVDCLQELAAARPDDIALTVVAERNDHWIETVLSYRVFTQRVLALAATLQHLFAKEERVLILLDNDEHYAISMFACFHAGVIAVPVFPPESARPQHLARLAGIALDAQASGILTLSTLKDMVATAASQFGVSTVIAVDEIDRMAADTWQPHRPDADDVAFLQYTSGSTSAPKGVMVTHANLMANERAIREGLSIGASDIFGVWSPLFHDMGLIGGLLQPFYSGIPCVLSSPRFFLERPVRWLQMIARHRVTISGGPDFAYRLCLDRISDAQIDDLDLSSWRIAYTGAEPVRHDTMDAFSTRFAPAGFDAGAVYPCYGLAEATLYVTGGQRGKGMVVTRFDETALGARSAQVQADGAALVGCGSVPRDHHVRIADPGTGAPVHDGAIGEIWAAGASIASGYWNKPAETAETFVERDGTRWLRTGDLGFLHDGQLFVAGRLKDMIIVRGHNLYPHDIERVVEAHVEAVRKGRVAAFSVMVDGVEGIAVAAEVSRGLQKLVPPQVLADAIGATVSEHCGQAPATVVLLNPGAMPKTSSGKLQRSACRQGWEKRSLDAYAAFQNGRCVLGEGTGKSGSAPHATDAAAPKATSGTSAPDDVAHDLSDIWRDLLGHEPSFRYASDAHFLALGGNSLAAVQLAARISQHWHIAFTIRHIFDHPRLAAQAAAIRAQVQAGPSVPATVIPVLSAEQRAQPLPLSSAQQRQWFLWRMDPMSTAYHVLGALRLKGRIDVDALRFAVDRLAKRHESLRTTFQVRADGEPLQVIAGDGALDLQVFDLRALPADAREAQCSKLLQDYLATPFDLLQGPLARAALVRTQEDEYVLALGLHHIIVDGASMHILLDEMATLYHARLNGTEDAALPEPKIHYADYAVWEQAHVDSEANGHCLDYWLKQLEIGKGESHPVLALPTHRPRNATGKYQAAKRGRHLPPALVAKLRDTALATETTLPMMLVAALQALLYRHTGQTDLRIGVPVANRSHTSLLGIPGLFVNTIVLRAILEGTQSLQDTLSHARKVSLEAQQHQELPFERLVEALRPERSLTHTPLFQVLFDYQTESFSAFNRWGGVSVQRYPLSTDAAQYELVLQVREVDTDQIDVSLIYAADLFDAAAIDRILGHYTNVLTTLVTNPTRAIRDASLLAKAELQQLITWGGRPSTRIDFEPVHRAFERRTVDQPLNVALVFADAHLSYGELNKKANQLAHYLIALGVQRETRVGIAVERSVEMVVGVLAVMKAGGAYVPLDLDYPDERLHFMVRDSGVALVLTQSRAASRPAFGSPLNCLELDRLDLESQSTANPGAGEHADNLAYIIYTSGSTGQPKGVAVSHRSLSTCMRWMQQTYALTSADSVLHKASFGFDVSVWETMWPLVAGARLVIANPGDHRDPARIAALVHQYQVTAVNFVPSMLRAFIDYDSGRSTTALRYIMCGGEAMPRELQIQARQKLPGVSLQNLYGPTETTIHVTSYTCVAGEHPKVPIGRPVLETQARVLDEALNCAPIGVPGQLYIGGALLARGYYGKPALTAERFVADPFHQDGGRLYRTGDLANWNAEGQLDYLGRNDQQIKVRGFRIELGEIEAALRAQPNVNDATVVVAETDRGPQLVAYVAAERTENARPETLKDQLSRRLPQYMIPSSYVVLPCLPLNANGKVDRRALPALESVKGPAYLPPDGAAEQAVAAIWAEVLKKERVGRLDNFFEIGGHSLVAIRLSALFRSRHGCEVPIQTFFEAPVLRDFASRIAMSTSLATHTRQSRLEKLSNLMDKFEE